jgi:adenine deaminase
MQQVIKANLVSITERKIFAAAIHIQNGLVKEIEPIAETVSGFILPGFIDAHIHIESSMLTPYEFARIALTHGTIATISDPHEIANVCGLQGVMYMLENAKDAHLKFHFGAPSCVPATGFETTGSTLNAADVATLLERNDIYYLSEMMNYPGVLNSDIEVFKKINSALQHNKPIDGHAPGLMGDEAKKYIEAGRKSVIISTDHECFTLNEALNKLQHGMHILIREGSAAKNFNALHTLITSHTDKVMFCTDDAHPDDLLLGHINKLVARSVALGYNVFDVLQCACLNPRKHYNTNTGALQVGQPADFILVENLKDFNVQATYVNGLCVAKNGTCILPKKENEIINQFNIEPLSISDIQLKTNAIGNVSVRVIEALEGQLITNEISATLQPVDGLLQSDVKQDVLKLVVVNRYKKSNVAFGFIKNFTLTKGAIASTVAHDSHNIICIGTSDNDMLTAINTVINNKGGLCVFDDTNLNVLPLPIAGLMSDGDAQTVAQTYADLNEATVAMGCKLKAPFMTLSFMALLVIPDLKLSDKGLFSGKSFEFTSLEVNQ